MTIATFLLVVCISSHPPITEPGMRVGFEYQADVPEYTVGGKRLRDYEFNYIFRLSTGDETKNPGSLLLWKPSPALTDNEGEWVDYSN